MLSKGGSEVVEIKGEEEMKGEYLRGGREVEKEK